MNCKKVIYNRFIKPLLNKKTGIIGTELEFPMLNMNRAPIDKEVALGLLDMFTKCGFIIEEKDTDGNPAFISNAYGDCISFDNSYNNIEFSMNYGDNLIEIQNRFYGYFNAAQDYLKDCNYLITGMGTNPYKKFITQSHVSYPVYNMVDGYLHKFNCDETHDYPDFPSYLSSVQTHLDIDVKDLPKTASLFAKIDFLRGILFSNSPDFELGNTLCYRDYLWNKSAFGLCEKNTGPVDEEYKTIDDMAESFYQRCMFNNIRDGRYNFFYPIKVADYFEDNPEKDIEQFLSFRHIEITCRGTLEIRSDCTQPVYDALLPPAFNLGIAHNIDEAIFRTDELLNGTNLSNSYLRRCISSGTGIKEFDKKTLSEYAKDMVNIAKEGLLSRQKGEEILLESIFKRAKDIICPSMYILDNKDNIDKVIKEYAEVNR